MTRPLSTNSAAYTNTMHAIHSHASYLFWVGVITEWRPRLTAVQALLLAAVDKLAGVRRCRVGVTVVHQAADGLAETGQPLPAQRGLQGGGPGVVLSRIMRLLARTCTHVSREPGAGLRAGRLGHIHGQ